MSKENSSLRTARQERIAKRNGVTVLAEKVQPVAAPVTTPVAPKAVKAPEAPLELVAAVLDPSAISQEATISMHLFGQGSQDPHWLVCAAGEPVAKIQLSDQDEPGVIEKIFTTDAYANSIIESSKRMSMPELLAGVKARPYIAKVTSSDAFKSLQTQIAAEATEDLRRTKANLRGDMLNMLGLVTLAQSKNFVAANSLKEAMFDSLRSSGIDNNRSGAIVEGSWQKGAESYFAETFKLASKWMDLSPETLAELKEQIVGMPNRTPVIASVEAPLPRAAYPREASNVNLVTTASTGYVAETPSDAKTAMRQALGFGPRSR